MKKANLFVVAVICLLAAPRAFAQGGNPPASTKESRATSGKGMTAVEQTERENVNGQIVGVWTLVSEEGKNPDGSNMLPFGPNPNGIVIFEPNGHYALQIIRSGLPKFASNNRTQGTPDENKAVVQGSLSHFGTYSVSGGNVVFHIESCSFPNWSGIESKRPFTMAGDELKWETTPASGGGVAVLVWKRAK